MSYALVSSPPPHTMDKSIQRGLNDRLYDKRKAVALDLERLIKQCVSEGQTDKINDIINQLCREYAYAVHQPNARNGGLIGLAAAAIALGQSEVANFLEAIIHPVLACFGDQDPRVRYYACEALYNISKVAKGEILVYFNEIFDVLCKLAADSEMSVKKGADLLDRLVKDIVAEKAATYVSVLHVAPLAENPDANKVVDARGKTLQVNEPQSPTAFSLEKFIPLLTERIYVINPYTRMFLVSWIRLLDTIPDLELVAYLPTFLGGLISFLSDTHEDVRVVTHSLLNMFLSEIKRIADLQTYVKERDSRQDGNGSINSNSFLSESGLYIPGQDVNLEFPRIIQILISHLDSSNEEIQIEVLQWIETILEISPKSFLSYVAKLLAVLLQTMANEETNLRDKAHRVNKNLMTLVESATLEESVLLNFGNILNTLTLHFMNEKEVTRVAALEWLTMLHDKHPKRLLQHSDSTFVTLLKALSDPSENVINRDLQLLAKISNESDDKYFNSFMNDLLTLFKKDRKLLETRGNFILRTMCLSLNPERIFKSLGEVLEKETDFGFISIMIQILNNNLITAPELAQLRKKLSRENQTELFSSLFKSWCHNPPAVLSLCLLCQSYELAFQMLNALVEFEITVNLLVQIDILVQLLESPIFAKLRIQLLEPTNHPYLYKCLYGILMLLPQSSAFVTLRNRLNSVSHLSSFPLESVSTPEDDRQINRELLEHFISVQEQHEEMSKM